MEVMNTIRNCIYGIGMIIIGIMLIMCAISLTKDEQRQIDSARFGQPNPELSHRYMRAEQ